VLLDSAVPTGLRVLHVYPTLKRWAILMHPSGMENAQAGKPGWKAATGSLRPLSGAAPADIRSAFGVSIRGTLKCPKSNAGLLSPAGVDILVPRNRYGGGVSHISRSSALGNRVDVNWRTKPASYLISSIVQPSAYESRRWRSICFSSVFFPGRRSCLALPWAGMKGRRWRL
jgi:hypothetical protein